MKRNERPNAALIQPLDCRRSAGNAGNKALNLCRLLGLGVRLPETFICGWEVHECYKREKEDILDRLAKDIAEVIDPNAKYAVRSSSDLEDDTDTSFAGQFSSFLNISGQENVLQAIQDVWAAVDKETVISYQEKRSLPERNIRMGIIIQKMIDPRLSGVALSSNPVTGEKDIIIEAVEGLGETLQKGATPLRWIFRYGKHLVDDKKNDPYTEVVEHIAAQTAKIARKLKKEVDLEWVYDGRNTYFVQVREIGSLRELKIYSNRISKDMLPGMIKPLIWSVNIPLINSVWLKLLENFVGDLHIKPEDLAKQFYYRTYFNMGIFGRIFNELGMPSDALEMMMGLRDKDQPKPSMKPSPRVIKHLPRITGFILSNLFFARKMRKGLTEMESIIDSKRDFKLKERSPQEIIKAIDELKPVVQQIAYYNITGPLVMSMYNNSLRKKLAKIGVDFLSFDLMNDSVENQRYDPNMDLEKLNLMFTDLPEKTQIRIRKSAFQDFMQIDGIDSFKKSVNEFIKKFGHFSDSGNDFSYVPWREKKDMILQMIMDFRKNAPAAHKTAFDDLDVKGLQRSSLNRSYNRARDYRNLRDRVSSDYTFGYGLFREYYLALGDYIAQKGVIKNRDDVFYITEQQIRQAVQIPGNTINFKKQVDFHKKHMALYAEAHVPERIIGDEEPILNFEEKNKLTGIPASAGYFKGRACVIRKVEDFPRMKSGLILVIPYSDVGWTPLFAKAGAVVAESGGMLSHSAIIAREYGLPAIVSVAGAMKIKDGRIITVDANNGTVYLHE